VDLKAAVQSMKGGDRKESQLNLKKAVRHFDSLPEQGIQQEEDGSFEVNAYALLSTLIGRLIGTIEGLGAEDMMKISQRLGSISDRLLLGGLKLHDLAPLAEVFVPSGAIATVPTKTMEDEIGLKDSVSVIKQPGVKQTSTQPQGQTLAQRFLGIRRIMVALLEPIKPAIGRGLNEGIYWFVVILFAGSAIWIVATVFGIDLSHLLSIP